jgi:hypothetical protein
VSGDGGYETGPQIVGEGSPVMDQYLARIGDAAGLLAWRIGVWNDLGYASPEPGQKAVPPLGQRSDESIAGARGAIEVIDGMTRDLRALRIALAGEIRADQDARGGFMAVARRERLLADLFGTTAAGDDDEVDEELGTGMTDADYYDRISEPGTDQGRQS